ncbi:MAG: hypothetical protein IJ515_01115 [Clostridia bacterium]|nr:hypothetical protein [Clostridia bacterium]
MGRFWGDFSRFFCFGLVFVDFLIDFIDFFGIFEFLYWGLSLGRLFGEKVSKVGNFTHIIDCFSVFGVFSRADFEDILDFCGDLMSFYLLSRCDDFDRFENGQRVIELRYKDI